MRTTSWVMAAIGVVTGVVAIVSAVLSADATASRRPTMSERRQITKAVLLEFERDSPAVPTRVTYVRVSTLKIRAYSRFALASVSGVKSGASQLAIQRVRCLDTRIPRIDNDRLRKFRFRL